MSKIPRKVSEEIINFYENIGIPASDLGNAEYSAYATFYGWMENKDLVDIEEEYQVYASQLPQVALELWRLLVVYGKLAYKKNLPVPDEFKDFRDRVRYGVTEEELPFVKIRGIGRESTRNIKSYCNIVLRRPPLNYKGSILEIFRALYVRGEKGFLDHIQYIKGIGKEKSKKILDFVKSKA